MSAARKPKASKLASKPGEDFDAAHVYRLFKAAGVGGDTPNIDIDLYSFLKPYFSKVSKALGVPIQNTPETHDLYSHFFVLMKSYVLVFGERKESAPPVDQLTKQTQDFIELKKKDPQVVPEWKTNKRKPFLFHWTAEEILALSATNRRPRTIDERIHHIKTVAKSLLGRSKTEEEGARIIFSVEHPDVPHTLTSILTMLKEFRESGVEVQIAKGAFRYTEGRYKGEVIQEISMVCHYQDQRQKNLILDWVEPYGQESYLHIDSSNNVASINLKSSEPWPLGEGQEILRANPEWLQMGQGYSIVNGIFYGTQEIVQQKQVA